MALASSTESSAPGWVTVIGVAFLLLVCPPFAFLLCCAARIPLLLSSVMEGEGLQAALKREEGADVNSLLWGDATSWMALLLLVLLQTVLMLVLPGRRTKGPPTPGGMVPNHHLNGTSSFVVTLVLFELGAVLGLWTGGVLYHSLLPLLAAASWLSGAITVLLYVKARTWPSSPAIDCSSSGSLLFDVYWGQELYPMIGNLQLKLLIHSRIGMTLWGLLNLSYLHASYELNDIISNALWLNAGLQLFYVAHHHYFEEAYVRTTDIVHDKEGFYLVYGCIVFMPFTFTLSGMWLVAHPEHVLSTWAAVAVAAACLLCNLLNFWADDQKLKVRNANGNCKIWGHPARVIRAKYWAEGPASRSNGNGTSQKGEWRESILLLSGWWGVSRHFHYLADIGGVFFWTLPAGAPWENPLVYFYWVFLTILFIDRARRDDARCEKKYGASWKEYKRQVPYHILPAIRREFADSYYYGSGK